MKTLSATDRMLLEDASHLHISEMEARQVGLAIDRCQHG